MISFATPALLALAAAPPLASLARRALVRRRPRALVLPLDAWEAGSSGQAPLAWRALCAVASLCSWLAWAALCAAAAGPAVAGSSAAFSNAGALVVFALDASPSMAAKDLEPTRLDAAKALIRAYVESPGGADGASVGLVAFGAEAALACPPTTDYGTLLKRLDSLEPGMLGEGTALGQGLAGAARIVAASGSPRAVVTLLSDGEDNVGLVHPEDAARALSSLGTGLLVVGIGSRGEVPIEYLNPSTGQRLSGLYRSGFDAAVLAGIAEAGGGLYRSAVDHRALEGLGADIRAQVRSGLPAGEPPPPRRTAASRRSVARPFFLAALALAAASWALRRLALGGLA